VVVVPESGVARLPDVGPLQPHVLVIDSQPLFVTVLCHLLGGSALRAQTRKAEGTATALEILRCEAVDLVLCDVRAQPLPVRDFLAEVDRLPKAPPVVLLGDVNDEALLLAAIDTAAAGFFTKDTEPAQFLEGVRAVLAGHRAVGATVMRQMVARMNGNDMAGVRPGLSRLSRTEMDILAMVGAAKSVQSIAAARGISQKTVRNHLANIYKKLELRSRTEAMLCAARLGLTSD
jgi:DNA-binding NarL/FixJ family response regulator